jgi:hypothetical protein
MLPFPFDGTAKPPVDAGSGGAGNGRIGGQAPIARTTGGRGRSDNT